MTRYRISLVALLGLACGAGPTAADAQPQRTQSAQPGRQTETPPAGRTDGTPTLAPLVERVRPTVVGVTSRIVASETTDQAEVPPELRDFWKRFFGGEPPPFHGGPEGPATGIGSGVIIDAKGVVLTNNHVVEGATEVTVRTADEKEHKARVVGTDPDTDIAVLQFDDVPPNLEVATLGSSDAVRVGDFVVAIGNPFGLELTVTSGIISAKARVIGAGPYDDFLQTDAAINPGNSGGPLFDLNGNVVGINTAIVASGSGIGFAVPIDLVKALLPQLRQTGRVVRGYLGVGIQDLTPELADALGVQLRKGAVVASVQPDAPARNLKPGDVVTAVEGQAVDGAAQLSRRVAQMKPGQQVNLTVLRDGKQQNVRVKLGERPSDLEKRPQTQKPEKPGALGLSLQDVPPEMTRELGVRGGALVADVRSGSRAEEAGLQSGDVIIEADRQPVASAKALADIVRKAGDKQLLLRVVREGGTAFVVVPPARK